MPVRSREYGIYLFTQKCKGRWQKTDFWAYQHNSANHNSANHNSANHNSANFGNPRKLKCHNILVKVSCYKNLFHPNSIVIASLP